MRHMQSIFVLAAIGVAACRPSTTELTQGSEDQLAGTASVIDGDTIEIHGERIRLDGFDSPERGSICGSVNVYKKAAFVLSDFIGQRTVICDISGKDRYDRKIGNCEAGGKSLAEFMVSEGWARDWPRYSHGAYADEERQARNARRGIWGLDCPADLWGDRNYD
ncbi:thermonuclease family protein [Hyphomonas atlantica]|nr:thermonuclease family protein [Hyphomonas atlantica]